MNDNGRHEYWEVLRDEMRVIKRFAGSVVAVWLACDDPIKSLTCSGHQTPEASVQAMRQATSGIIDF
ncbi:hypothetical protein DL98DRAFT_521871 [Cadophora sp. DSE1049]|nr:hypothetical protein DL98DRAFT_521871 [Cadophora sp. DSE1049]